MRIQGKLYTGRNSRERKATLIVEEMSAYFETDDGFTPRFALQDLNIHAKLGTIPRVIETPAAHRFESEDFAAIESLELQIGKKNFVHRLEREWKIAAPIALLLVLSIVFVYKVLIPTYSGVLAKMVPIGVRREISRPFETYLDKIYGSDVKLSKNKRAQYEEAVQDLLKEEPKITSVELLDAAEPNSFILPDDRVYVTKGLANLVESPDELLSVLLHEAGHAHYSHAMQTFIESSAVSFGLILISGGTEWTNVPIILLTNTYSRENETVADTYAISRLQQLHKDPGVFADIFERLQSDTEKKTGAIPAFLSTHPSFEDRIARIRALRQHK